MAEKTIHLNSQMREMVSKAEQAVEMAVQTRNIIVTTFFASMGLDRVKIISIKDGSITYMEDTDEPPRD